MFIPLELFILSNALSVPLLDQQHGDNREFRFHHAFDNHHQIFLVFLACPLQPD